MKLLFLLPLMLLIYPQCSMGQQKDGEARNIFKKVDKRRSSITSEKSELKMVIYNSNGAKRKRAIESFTTNKGANSNRLLIFKAPANVRGTGFLTIRKGDEGEQKLYLPALKRIQTISASQKSDRFMGSDFTYEDLGNPKTEDYTFSLEAKTDTTLVLYAVKKGRSQYDHIKFFIHPQKYALLKAEYFNKNGQMIKKLVAHNLQEVKANVWLPQELTMFDLGHDRKTTLAWKNRSVNVSIPSWRFTERGLKRGI